MTLAPYPRRVARVAMPTIMRWPDMPAGAVRQVAVDTTEWADQVEDDPPTEVTVAITPDDAGLADSGAAVDGNILGLTLTAAAEGIGTDYAVTLTATTAGGRIEVYGVRILITDPTAA